MADTEKSVQRGQALLHGTKTILLVGVGGQGTILAGKLLATVAAGAGLDVKVSEIHGMSQRGGSVSTVIRLGEHVSTMVCDDGCADVVVAFEAVEALRAQHYLAEGGKMFVNDEEITPVSVNIGNFAMPERVDERLRELGDAVSRVAAEAPACVFGGRDIIEASDAGWTVIDLLG